MAKLVLYSGGQTSSNQKLHPYLMDLAGSEGAKSITYIPSCSLGAGVDYRQFKRRYERYGVTRFQLMTVDKPLSREQLLTALASDIIYLDGGNTFYFLKHLRASGMLQLLRRYVRKGGVLGGLSAGAILMTPNIGLAGYPKFNADDNEVGLEDLSSLNLTNFEIYPHYVGSRREIQSLKNYSKRCKDPIYAISDGSGIVINGQHKTFVGSVELYYNGHSFPLS